MIELPLVPPRPAYSRSTSYNTTSSAAPADTETASVKEKKKCQELHHVSVSHAGEQYMTSRLGAVYLAALQALSHLESSKC